MLLFTLQNRGEAPINFLLMKWTLPLYFLGWYGFFIGMMVAIVGIWKLSSS